MAKVTGPLFSMGATGSFGNIVFNRKGFAYLKTIHSDPQTANQGDFRQTMSVAQKCVKACGPTTWNGYLVKNMIGRNRTIFSQYRQNYMYQGVDKTGWEAAADSMGVHPVSLEYANEAAVSPGEQLFILASTLFSLGVYSTLDQPNGNPEAWRDNIIS